MLKRFITYTRFLVFLLRTPEKIEAPFFHDFQTMSSTKVDRVEFIEKCCVEKRVLHFGFLDAPFMREKIDGGTLLHTRIKQKAAYLFGVDIDQNALTAYRQITGDDENVLYDIQTVFDDPEAFCKEFDVIIFSEILEHLKNPGQALKNLHHISAVNRARVCVTVPNAFSTLGISQAILGNEAVHPDHYHYYSYQTLRKILEDSGFGNIELRQYTSKSQSKSPGLTGHGIIALCEP